MMVLHHETSCLHFQRSPSVTCIQEHQQILSGVKVGRMLNLSNKNPVPKPTCVCSHWRSCPAWPVATWACLGWRCWCCWGCWGWGPSQGYRNRFDEQKEQQCMSTHIYIYIYLASLCLGWRRITEKAAKKPSEAITKSCTSVSSTLVRGSASSA